MMRKIKNAFRNCWSRCLSARYRLGGSFIGKGVIFRGKSKFKRVFLNGSRGSIAIGSSCELSHGVVMKTYGGGIHLGTNVFIGEYVVIYGHGGVTIGENSLISMHTCIISSNHSIPPVGENIRSKPDLLLPVDIGKDVWIGAGCQLLGGVQIGDGCVVGAGAVVTRSLPPNSICTGAPAKPIRFRDQDQEKSIQNG